MVNLLNKLVENFNSRHSFYEEDLIILRNNFPKIYFGDDIPQAWIISIHDMLESLDEDSKNIIKSIYQYKASLVISYKSNPEDLSKKSYLLLTKKVRKIKSIISNIDSDIWCDIEHDMRNFSFLN